MHATTPTDNFRKAAEAVRLNIQEMTPVKGEKGIWQLPVELREKKTEFYALMNLYNTTEYGGITKRAASRGLSVAFDNAVEVLLVQSRIPGVKNRMYVAIIIPTPQSENVPGDERSPTSPSKVPAKRRHPHQNTGRTIEETPATKQKTTHQTNENVALEAPRERDEALMGKEIDPNTLRQQPKVLITSLLAPPAFTIGAIIEVDDVDVLHVATGAIAMVLIRYRIEKLVKGAENQDM